MPDFQIPVHKTHGEASASLRNRELIVSPSFQRSAVKWPKATNPALSDFLKGFIKDLHAAGYPLRPVEILRDRARQNALYVSGNSKAKFGQSAHNYGLAVDVVHHTRGWKLSRLEWDLVGAVGKETARKRKLKLVWGGDWEFYDPAHWELADWRFRSAHNGMSEAEVKAAARARVPPS